jgi:hypothetical protein
MPPPGRADTSCRRGLLSPSDAHWPRLDAAKLILYPELIYRCYQGDDLLDEAVLKIAMRCYYPDEFVQLITKQGFRVLKQWGGYAAEPYGKGPELIIQFTQNG